MKRQNKFLDYLFDPSYQRVSRIFAFSSENDVVRTKHTRYFLPKIEIKNYTLTINRKLNSDQSLKMIFEKLQMIMKIITQLFFTRLSTLQRTLNMIAVGLTKQQALAIDPKAVKQTNFT